MLVISLLTTGMSLLISFQPMMIYTLLINLFFVLAYLWIWYFKREEI